MHPHTSGMLDSTDLTSGWEARLELHYALRGRKTRLIRKRQLGPLTLQRPFYPEGSTCHSYILHPPGGVAGTDSLHLKINAHAGAHCLLTTPGATKFYRTTGQCRATVLQEIQVSSTAAVEWLPQQNIFFPGANAALSTSIDITPGGKYLGWEINCLGLPANKQTLANGSMRSTTRVSIGGELRLSEQLHIDNEHALYASAGMRSLPLQGCLIAAPCTNAQRQALEQILQQNAASVYPHPAGLTLVDDILVLRALGEQTEPMLKLFTLLWAALRESWLHKAPCPPRIWST